MNEHRLKAIKLWVLATVFYVAACASAVTVYLPG